MAELGRITPVRPGEVPKEPASARLDRIWSTAIMSIGGFSFIINLLNMVIPIYSLQVFDRVLGSRSTDTLIILTIGIAMALGLMAVMELIRSRIMVRIGTRLEAEMGERLFAHTIRAAAKGGEAQNRPLRDLSALKGFLTGPGMFSLLDIPWAPLYLIVVVLFDYRLGAVACIGAGSLLLIAFLSDLAAKAANNRAEDSQTTGRRNEDVFARSAEAMESMGITETARRRWKAEQSRGLLFDGLASRRMGVATTLSHAIRLGLQVAFIGTGAYLVIHNSISIGIMVACMILGMRGLAPFESAAMTWRGWNGAVGAKARLKKLLDGEADGLDSPAGTGPGAALIVDKLVYVPAGSRAPLFKGFSFKVGAGQILGVAGFNGSGKSTLLKLLMGVWSPTSGSIKVDDVEASRLNRGEFGAQLGYLAQEPRLFPGTIADNIARLGEVVMRDVVQAAELAGIHRTILDMPEGYDTLIKDGGRNLSAGQRQLIALAAALYGKPRLLLLDEPTSALDTQGLKQVSRVLDVCRKAGITAFVVSHDRDVLVRTDAILCLANGQIQVIPTEVPEKKSDKPTDAKPKPKPALTHPTQPDSQPALAAPAAPTAASGALPPLGYPQPAQSGAPHPGTPQMLGQPVGAPSPGVYPYPMAPATMSHPGAYAYPVAAVPPGYYPPPGYVPQPMPVYPQPQAYGYPAAPPPPPQPQSVQPRPHPGVYDAPNLDPNAYQRPAPSRVLRRKPDIRRREVRKEAPPQTVAEEAIVESPREPARPERPRTPLKPELKASPMASSPRLRVVGGLEHPEEDKEMWQ